MPDTTDTYYRVEVVCKDVLPRPFRPLLPSPAIFKKDATFRIFLLTKRTWQPEKERLHTQER